MYLVIDIGSNTIRAVVFHISGGRPLPVMNRKYSAGLAGYVNEDGSMSRQGIELCADSLSEIRIAADSFSFDGIFPFATASLRNITNSKEVIEEINQRCGFQIQLLTGKEEAFFDYYGASQTMESGEGILIDIGGGSTEIVSYKDGLARASESVPIGSLNLYNEHVEKIIPTREELHEICLTAKRQLQTLPFAQFKDSKEERPVICAVGGTARAALKLYNVLYEKERSNDVYKRCFLKDLLDFKWEKKQISQLILKVAPERIHTLLPGAAVLYTAAKYFGGKEIITCPYGVREGYIQYQLEKAGVLNG